MSHKIQIGIILFAIINIYPITLIQTNDNPSTISFKALPKINHSDLVTIIQITSNDQFQQYSAIGNGTKNNPYILENYFISNVETNTFPDAGISIINTSAYFVIRNVTVSYCYNGIYLANVSNGIVYNSLVENNTGFRIPFPVPSIPPSGIAIANSKNTSFINNTLQYNNIGFYSANSSNTFITNNLAYRNQRIGFDFDSGIQNSSFDIVSNNIAEENYDGFGSSSPGVNFTNNLARDNEGTGFYSNSLDYFDNNTSNNNFDGFALTDRNFTAMHELFPNLTLTLTKNSAHFNFDDGFYFSSLEGGYQTFYNGTSGKFDVLSNLSTIQVTTNMAMNNKIAGFELEYSSGINFSTNFCSLNAYGFFLDNSPNNSFSNNVAESNSWANFYESFSFNNKFSYNYFPILVPRHPQYLTGKLQSLSVTLSWEKPVSDGGSNITEYQIFRSTDNKSFTIIGETLSFQFTDNSLRSGTEYYYLIKAVNDAGVSSPSNIFSINLPYTLNDYITITINYSLIIMGFIIFLGSIGLGLHFIQYRSYVKNTPLHERPLSFQNFIKLQIKAKILFKKKIVDPHATDQALKVIERIIEDEQSDKI